MTGISSFVKVTLFFQKNACQRLKYELSCSLELNKQGPEDTPHALTMYGMWDRKYVVC
jgi:hypothetical protein